MLPEAEVGVTMYSEDRGRNHSEEMLVISRRKSKETLFFSIPRRNAASFIV